MTKTQPANRHPPRPVRKPTSQSPLMRAASPHLTRNSVPHSARDPRAAEVLARELRHVIEHAQNQRTQPGHQVLLDKEFHGFRVVLTHTLLEKNHAVTLSPRELEIARMIGKGLPNKMIADVLDISAWTVGTHLRRIFAKLGVSCRAAMVTEILERAGLSPDQGKANTNARESSFSSRPAISPNGPARR